MFSLARFYSALFLEKTSDFLGRVPSCTSVAQWIDGAFAYGFTFLPSLVQCGSGSLWLGGLRWPLGRNSYHLTADLYNSKFLVWLYFSIPLTFFLKHPFGGWGLNIPRRIGHVFLLLSKCLMEKPKDMPKYPPPQSFYEGGEFCTPLQFL